MTILGNAIVIVILAVVLFFCVRSCIRTFKGELKGNGCAGCNGGNCSCGCCKNAKSSHK